MLENFFHAQSASEEKNRVAVSFYQAKRPGLNMIKWILVGWILLLSCENLLSQELLITAEDHGPPKYYMEEGEAKGFIVDITRWVLVDMDYPHQFRLYPWKRAYRYALDGEAGIIGLSMSSKRLAIFDFSKPLFYGDLMLVVKKGNEFEFNSIEDLTGKRVAVGRGSSYGDAFDEAVNAGAFEIEEYSKSVNVLHMLLYERGVDALIIGPGKYGLEAVVKTDNQLRMEQFTILPVPFKRDAKYLGLAKSMGMKPFIKKFNESLKKAWDRGVIDQLVGELFK